MSGMMSPADLEAALRAIGAERYHNLHPFHRRMDAGELTREELRRWVTNRFYYQKCIPLKDAAILANCPEVEVRRAWIQRIIDHDGTAEGTGGTESWLRLGEALGVTRDELLSEQGVLPGVRYAVDAYVNFARQRPWIEAVASSLTELFSPQVIGERVEGMLRSYDFVDADTLAYFSARPPLAQRDSEFALDYVKRRAGTPEAQHAVLRALEFKCDVLWAMLDALYHAYVAPRHLPPGAFVPKEEGRR